ncbi:MAG: MoaD family protein [Candidatus Asgardarchaeia archaeon]
MAKVRVLPLARVRAIMGVKETTIEAETVEELIKKLIKKYGKNLEAELFDSRGNLKDYYRIVINGRNIKLLNGLKTRLKDNDLVAIMPPIAGGKV